MNYETFFTELEGKIFRSEMDNIPGAELIIHLKGEKAEANDTETDQFIRSTNSKYFNADSGTLMDDFAELKFPGRTGSEKTNYIRFRIRYLHEIYTSRGWNGVRDHVTDNIRYADRIESSADDILSVMDSYSKIRERLIIRPLSLKYNKAQLEGFVYKAIGDIALVLYAIVLDDSENNCLNTVKIPEPVCRKWNIDPEKLIMSTLLNTNILAMPRMYTNLPRMESTPDEESAFMSAECTLKSLKPAAVPLVTTTRKTNGAVAVFYPGVKEKIAELFGDSFYVAFTSIHEAMIHKKGTVEPSSIRKHIRATNDTFGPEDTLSDNVFFYNMNTGEFSMVAE